MVIIETSIDNCADEVSKSSVCWFRKLPGCNYHLEGLTIATFTRISNRGYIHLLQRTPNGKSRVIPCLYCAWSIGTSLVLFRQNRRKWDFAEKVRAMFRLTIRINCATQNRPRFADCISLLMFVASVSSHHVFVLLQEAGNNTLVLNRTIKLVEPARKTENSATCGDLLGVWTNRRKYISPNGHFAGIEFFKLDVSPELILHVFYAVTSCILQGFPY